MIFSNYLNKDINIKTDVASTQSGKKTIVFHSDLEAFIHEELVGIVSYEYSFVHPGDNVVVCCTMWDNVGRRVSAIGEATKNTLVSSVDINHPTTTAANRAFDRAAIRFLALGKGVYSNKELPPDGPKNFENSKLVDGATEPLINEPEGKPEIAHKEESKEKSEGDKKTADAVTEDAQSNVDIQQSPEDDANVVISMGTYKGKNKTVEEIFKEKPSWLGFMADKIKSTYPETKKQIDAIKGYLTKHCEGAAEGRFQEAVERYEKSKGDKK